MKENGEPDDLTPDDNAELKSLIQQLRETHEGIHDALSSDSSETSDDDLEFEEVAVTHEDEPQGTVIPEIREELKAIILRQKEWSDIYSYEDVQATAVSVLRELHEQEESSDEDDE